MSTSLPSLNSRILESGLYAIFGKILQRGMNFIKIILIAHFLSPKDFGLYGIVTLSIATILAFSETGFKAALIYEKNNINDLLQTAWVIEATRGVLAALILILGAPLVAWFFEEPRVILLLQLSALSFILKGTANIGVVVFNKELDFRKVTFFESLSEFAGLVLGLILAYTMRSAWALVVSYLATDLFKFVLSYALHQFRPKLSFNLRHAKGLMSYGKWIFASSIITFLALNLDSTIVGKVLGATALGFYRMAFTISNTPATEISHLTATIMMPAYAKMQEDSKALSRMYLEVFELTMTIALPLSIFLILAAPEIIYGVLGANWKEAILPLQLLSIAGFIRAIVATAGPVFLGVGMPRLDFKMNSLRVLLLSLAVYPFAFYWGVVGACISVILSIVITVPSWFRGLNVVGVGGKAILERFWPSLALGCMVPPGIFLARVLGGANILSTLVMQIMLLIISFLFTAYMLGIKMKKGPYMLVEKIFSSSRANGAIPQ